MIPSLTPAELRAAIRLRDLYPEAYLDLHAQEEAAEAARAQVPAVPADARVWSLLDTEHRAEFAEYLDRLETTHGRDRAMREFIDQHRARLAQGGAT